MADPFETDVPAKEPHSEAPLRVTSSEIAQSGPPASALT
jgi:hypothetical protein